ncbi:CobW-like GTP-binding protein [Pseudomonas sp. HR96]|uniref:CobW family GTP-binding protein n=1 Tax=Pseudomonas sp. HR96 TaxID=1027966 RepID=UPI002A759DA7|nr:CobW-like GTP-binding protein [Pseudomonas sp. HR96]WPO99968.1 CobW-like GTP-binding protein [Pseudomonas sp. HR96]
MLQNILTHVIAGPLGAGKTTLIRHLLGQRPPTERWAVLINEFGPIGLDAALLASDDDGIALGEVAGGCLCCVNGAPFQVGLARLLRKARPDRLFIEPSGLGHPVQLLQQLGEPPWQGVLDVQPLVMVLDAASMAKGYHLPDSQQAALEQAGLLVMNKSAQLEDSCRLALAADLADSPTLDWRDADQLALADLPQTATIGQASGRLTLDERRHPSTAPALSTLWRSADEPVCQINAQAEGWSIGWRWHASVQFERAALEAWLRQLAFRRAKLVVRSPDGWHSLNAVDNTLLQWRSSEWRRDSRLELIFATPQDQAALHTALSCLRVA